MGAEYKLRFRTGAGVLVGEVADFLDLAYSKQVNRAGMLTARFNSESPVLRYVQTNGIVEVWRQRREENIAWHCDFYGLTGDTEYQTDSNGINTTILYCPSVLSLLNWRIIAYSTDDPNSRANFTSVVGETALKRLAEYNFTSSGTTGDGRTRNAYRAGNPVISIDTDDGGGNTVSWAGSWKPLLPELERLAEIAGGDFDLVSDGSGGWVFNFYAGQLGTDRSASVVFSYDRGNVGSASLKNMQLSRPTVAIVGGDGAGATRTLVVRTASDWTAANDKEMWVDGSTSDTVSVLNSFGDRALAEAQKRATQVSMEILQQGPFLYGRHYFLGDKVAWEYRGQSGTARIRDVRVSVPANGPEDIQIGIEGL